MKESFESRLGRESIKWEREGLITSEQRAAIAARHPIGETGPRFIGILGTIGGAFVVAGVGLLIASHWHQIGDWVKLAGLGVLLVGAHAAGWHLRISPGRFPRMGEGFFMIGCVLFLLGIALVSQIFHLNSRPPSGVLLWWLGIVALPWIVRVKSAQFVSLAALLIWLTMELNASDSWLRLTVNGRSGGDGWVFAAAFFLIGSALFFSGLALRGGAHRAFAGLHEKVGLLVINVALAVLTFGWSRDLWMSNEVEELRSIPFALFGLLLAAAAATAWGKKRDETQRMAGWVAIGLVPVLGVVLGPAGGAAGWWWGLAACFALFLLNVGMIQAGIATGRESWINLGVAFVAFNLVARYIDLFGPMLDGGFFFVTTGGIVLGLGFYLERKRRSLLAKMRKEHA